MKSKTKIEKKIQKKTNKELVETIIATKKNKAWLAVADVLSSSRKNKVNMNLGEIDKKIKNEKKVVVSGKVLSQGELNKKIEIVALGFSKKAKEKILKSGCKFSNISEEIKKNPGAKGVRILKARNKNS